MYYLPLSIAQRWIIRLIWLWPLILLGWLLNQNYLITSKLTHTLRPGESVRSIQFKDPQEVVRTADTAECWRPLNDRLDFSVLIPRRIPSLSVAANLESINQPIIWLDAPGTSLTGDSRTLVYSQMLQQLTWPTVTDGRLTLWQRPGQGFTYSSVDEFITSPPKRDQIMVEGVSPYLFYELTASETRTAPIRLPHSLRGKHDIYVTAGPGDLRLEFDKVDLNRQGDADPMRIRIARAEDVDVSHPNWIKNIDIADDGDIKASNKRGRPIGVSVVLPNPKAGLYLVRVETSEDVLLENVASYSEYIASPRWFIAAGPDYYPGIVPAPLEVSALAKSIWVTPIHIYGRQKIKVASSTYSIENLKVQHELVGILPDVTTIEITKPDVIVEADGLVTLGPAPEFPLQALAQAELDGLQEPAEVNYVLAKYQVMDQTKRPNFEQEFELSELALKTKTVDFALQFPGLREKNNRVCIDSLQTTFTRGPFPWQAIQRKLIPGT